MVLEEKSATSDMVKQTCRELLIFLCDLEESNFWYSQNGNIKCNGLACKELVYGVLIL